MFIIKQCNKYFVLPFKHFEYGIRRIKLLLINLYPQLKSEILKTYLCLLGSSKLLTTITLTSVPQKQWIKLTDLRVCNSKETLLTSWLQTLIIELIGKGRSYNPWWNEKSDRLSKKLWLPSGEFNNKEKLSWFTTQKLTNSDPPSIKYLQPKQPNYVGLRNKKIRFYPNNTQRTLLLRWMGTRRYLYNKLVAKQLEQDRLNVESIKREKVTGVKQEPIKDFNLCDYFKLRKQYVNKDKVEHQWELETPSAIRNETIRELSSAYKTNISLIKQGKKKHFKLKFKTRKKSDSMPILKSNIKVKFKNKIEIGCSNKARKKPKNQLVYIFPSYMKRPLKVSEKLPEINHDLRIAYQLGKWYFIIPVTMTQTQSKSTDWCSVDPGVRKFVTVYSEKEVVKVIPDRNRINQLHSKLDLFHSLRSRKIIKQQKLKRKQQRINCKLSNLINDLHNKTIHYLTSNYLKIFLPTFDTQEMVKRSYNKNLNRDLLCLKFFQFKEKLKAKALLKGVDVEIVTEEYTSQHCTRCGTINNMKGDETYCCAKCHLCIDRDVLGSRNIGIKSFC